MYWWNPKGAITILMLCKNMLSHKEHMMKITDFYVPLWIAPFEFHQYILSQTICHSGRVRILIKTRLKVKFDRFTIEKMSNFTFNRVLMSIRTRPQYFINIRIFTLQFFQNFWEFFNIVKKINLFRHDFLLLLSYTEFMKKYNVYNFKNPIHWFFIVFQSFFATVLGFVSWTHYYAISPLNN